MFLRAPLSKLADISGRKIRGVGGYSDTALKALGASVVFMSAAEQFIQLETGGVDGVITTSASYVNLGLGGVAPYVMANTLLRSPYALMMNKRKWDRLSDPSKVALMKAVKETVSWSNANFAEESARLEKELTKQSKSIYNFTEEDWALARKARDKAMADFTAESGEDAKALLEIYKRYH
jgi:TRAP-type C4-dicarboxylate transport system substrate-binding protein